MIPKSLMEQVCGREQSHTIDDRGLYGLIVNLPGVWRRRGYYLCVCDDVEIATRAAVHAARVFGVDATRDDVTDIWFFGMPVKAHCKKLCLYWALNLESRHVIPLYDAEVGIPTINADELEFVTGGDL